MRSFVALHTFESPETKSVYAQGFSYTIKDGDRWLNALRPNESFGLTDARVVMPAIGQLLDSDINYLPRKKPRLEQVSQDWITSNTPTVFDPQFFVHSSDDRLREHYKKTFQQDQPAQSWLGYANLFDPQYLCHWVDDRSRDRYKKTPRLDQPAAAWNWYSINHISGTGALAASLAAMSGAGTVTGTGVFTLKGNRLELDPRTIEHRNL